MVARKLVVAACAGALAVAGLALPMAGSAAAAPGLKDDFNGDGYRDLVIGTPKANAVTVTFGSSSGVGTGSARSVTLTQNAPGVPGALEPEDEFGENVTSGDVNNDGYADLIVGAPGEKADGRADGSLTVLWGGARGFRTGGIVLNAPSGEDVRFGEGASFVDLDGDGSGNLAVVSENRFWWYADGVPDGPALGPEVEFLPEGVRLDGVLGGHFSGGSGSDYVLHGTDAAGHGYAGHLRGGAGDIGYYYKPLFQGAVSDVITEPRVAAGDLDGNGYSDLVLGEPGTGTGGRITVWPGNDRGLGVDGWPSRSYSQASTGVPGTDEPGDGFGGSVAAGDVTGDGYADVAVGAPGETVDGVKGVGNVVLLKGSASGLGRGTSWQQATPGVPGVAEPDDAFGSAVRLKDINRNGRADLAIGALGEDIGGAEEAGAVWVLRGTTSGLTTSYATSFSAIDFGMGGNSYPAFGTILR